MEFIYRITLQGTRTNDKTTLSYDLGDFDIGGTQSFDDVQNAANQIRGALVDITDAFVSKELITAIVSEDNQLPADADATDELVLVVHLNAPAEAEKLHTMRVPAPIDAVWASDMVTLDLSNVDVVQFVQQIAQHAFVSDGEQINTSSGTNGIKRGYFRSRAKVLSN